MPRKLLRDELGRFRKRKALPPRDELGRFRKRKALPPRDELGRFRKRKTLPPRKAPPLRPPEPEDGGSFDFCNYEERIDFYDTLEADTISLRRQLESDPETRRWSTRIFIDFHFTNLTGEHNVQRFQHLDSLYRFLVGAEAYPGGHRRDAEGKFAPTPDWSPEGLCQYAKRADLVWVSGEGLDSKGRGSRAVIHTVVRYHAI